MDEQYPNAFPSAVRTYDHAFSKSSEVHSHAGYPQSFQRHTLGDVPVEDYAHKHSLHTNNGGHFERLPSRQRHTRSLSMQDADPYMGSALLHGNLGTFYQTHRGAASVNCYVPPQGNVDRRTAYEYPHSVCSEHASSDILYAQQSTLNEADAPRILSPSVQTFSAMAPPEPGMSYVEQYNNGAPSILNDNFFNNANGIWSSSPIPRPTPYALLPAIQVPSNPEPRASSETSVITSAADFEAPPRSDTKDAQTTNENTISKKKKQAKMHQCEICLKQFPRCVHVYFETTITED